MPPAKIHLNFVPADWVQRAEDFEARWVRAGVGGRPVIEASERDVWGGDGALALPDLISLLLPHRQLGQVLVDALVKDPDGRLSRTLRSNTAVPMPPTPEEGLLLLAITLARAVNVDPSRQVPYDVLRLIGQQGADLVSLLQPALATGARASPAESKAALKTLLDMAPWPERAALQKALEPAPAPDTFQAPAAKAPLAVAAVSPAELAALGRVTLSSLAGALTYGSTPSLVAANASLGPPPDALGQKLQQAGARPGDPRALRAAVARGCTPIATPATRRRSTGTGCSKSWAPRRSRSLTRSPPQ